MHSVRLEPTKLIWIGTRTTYQATGDAGIICYLVPKNSKIEALLQTSAAETFTLYLVSHNKHYPLYP